MEKSKYIFGISCVISILLLLLSVLVCVGLTILILSLVNNEKPYKQSINLISNQTLQLELETEDCSKNYNLGMKRTFLPLILSISNPILSKFSVYLHAKSNTSQFNNSCLAPPGDTCNIILDNSKTFFLSIQSTLSTDNNTQSLEVVLTCDSSTDPMSIVGAVILATGVVVGIGLLIFTLIILFDWCYFQNSANAIYG